MGLTLLDTSAVIAYLYADDALHEEAAAAIEGAVRDGEALALSAVSWTELLNGARVSAAEQDAVRSFAADFGVAIRPVDAQVAERAAALQGTFARRGERRDHARLRTPDALILATADVDDDVGAVIGGDAQWPKVPGVRARIRLLRGRRR